jgi:hypothetical protein
MREITITLSAPEAHMILDPIQQSAQDDQIVAAKSKDEGEREWRSIRAQVRQRVATAIVDQLIPQEDPERVVFREEYELGMV